MTPLDWGLGHATRCIPIIKQLISLNCEVLLAASGDSLNILRKEFPGIVILRIKGYKITYSKNKFWLAFKILLQLPKIYFLSLQDHKWLKWAINDYQIDAVISDNRLGMFNKKIPSIYITHQLFIKTGNSYSEKIAQKMHNYFIGKYKNCWVPDFEINDLAGILSHPEKINSNVSYLGGLSRFEKLPGIPIVYDLLILISGPEPQRTVFEKIILSQCKIAEKKILLVRGLPGRNDHEEMNSESLKITNHLQADELNLAIHQSEIIISRSGYTTIMDLAKLGKKAILVPTPGQPEQEYLAGYMLHKKYFYSVSQQQFSLDTALNEAATFQFVKPELSMDHFRKIINEFVQSLKSGNFATQ